MLKRFIYTAFLFFPVLLITACEDVIDVDLKTSPNQLVIEGNITDKNAAQIVKITNLFLIPIATPILRLLGLRLLLLMMQDIPSSLPKHNRAFIPANR